MALSDSKQVPLSRLVCAWCDDVLRDGGEPESHGLCPDCFETFPLDDLTLERVDADSWVLI